MLNQETDNQENDVPLPNAGMLADIFDKIQDYIAIQVELFKLQSIGKVATAGNKIISGLIMFTLFTFFLFILSMGIAFWIGDALGQTYAGFLIVAGVYLLAIIIIYIFRKKLFHKLIQTNLTSQLLK